ncbi:MAG: FkbM family methyltransferase [Elusimicrobia bacterium]|nr:FkbM family methyltransferase [Elusimicrobiota bacterium]
MTDNAEQLPPGRSDLLDGLDRLLKVRRLSKLGRLRNFPLATARNSLKMRLVSLYASWFGGHMTPTVDTFFGERMTLVVPPLGDIWLYGADIDIDAEARLTKFLIRDLREGEVFFDLGANLGYYSLLAAKLVGATGCVHAFEPSPFLLPLLRANLKRKPNAQAVDKALSDKTEVTRFFIAPLPFIGTSSLRPDWQRRTTPTEVETISLDEYCRSRDVSPSFLKIDVEGLEDKVISGGAELLKRSSPRIALEVLFNPIQDVYRNSFRLLRDLGYRPSAINAEGRLDALGFEDLDDYFQELGRRYQVVHDVPNDFDNLIFKKP